MDHEVSGESPEQSALDKAAEMGQLPGIQDEDEMEQRGEDHSETADADDKADEAGRDDLPGAIAMGRF